MVELPSVPRRLVTTETPRNRVTGEDIAAPGRALARAIGGIGEDLTEIGRAALDRQKADLGNQIDMDVHKASLEHAGNPEGFKAWAAGYGRELVKKERSPFLKRSVEEMVGNATTRRYNALTTQLHEATFTNAKTSMVARIESIDNTLSQMAREGTTGSAEYAAAVAERDDLYAELERQPLYGMPPEVTKALKARADGRAVAEAVVGSAMRHGLGTSSGSVVDRIIGAESGGSATATNPRSTATGDGQFTEGTWLDIIRSARPDLLEGRSRDEVLALRNDPVLSREMTAELARQNADFLGARGHAASPVNIYLAHFAGAGGAAALLGADPSASAESILGEAAVIANPFLKGMTAGDVIAWAGRKMGDASVDAESLLRERIWAIDELSPEDRTRYINYGISELNKIDAERTRAAGELAEAYERWIIDAAAGAGPIFARSDIENDAGLTEAGRNALLTKYDTATKEMRAEGQAYARFASGGSFNAFDSDDRKSIDRIYEALGGDGVALKQVVDQTGVAPPSVVTGLRGDIVSTDPNRLGAGLQLAANLITANPNVFAGHEGGEAVEKAALTFRHFVDNYGYSAEEAAARMAEMNTPEFKARVSSQVKGEDINELVKKNIAVSDLRHAFDTSMLPTGEPTIGFTPEIRQGMFGDYADLFRDRYMEHGDVELAKGQAIAQLKKVWGVSNVNGSEVVMRYPPERVPGLENVENPSDLIADDAIESILADSMGDRFVAAPNPTGMIERGNIDLAARPQVKNADGSISTVRSMSFNLDGREVLIPTVSDDGRILSDQDAIAEYRRTGRHLGIFDTPANATGYANALHDQQDRFYNSGATIDRSSLQLLPIAGVTSTAFKAGQPVPYMLAWRDADGIVHEVNPGRAFVVDPANIKARQAAEREKAFREGRDPANRGVLDRLMSKPPLPWESATPPAEPSSRTGMEGSPEAQTSGRKRYLGVDVDVTRGLMELPLPLTGKVQ